MATMYAKTAGGNWSAAGTWSATSAGGADSVGPPSATTDVVFELLSGNVTINSTAACRSLNTTSGVGTYGGILVHAASVNLTIGDGTAGAGNVAFKLNSGMTYTLNSATSSALIFASTNGTQQSITFGTKSTGNVSFTGVGSSYLVVDTWTTTGTVTLTSGTLNSGSQALNWGILSSAGTLARTLTLGSSTLTISSSSGAAWGTATTTLFTFNANSSVIILTAGNMQPGNLVFNEVRLTGTTSAMSNTNGPSFAIFERSLAVPMGTFTVDGNFTVTGSLKINGALESRLFFASSVIGTQRTITITGATMVWSYVDLRDINLSTLYDASGITGGSGDHEGNNNITFTNASTQTWQGTSGGNWTDATKWTSRQPLPQDDVIVNAAFSAGQTITINAGIIGKTVNFTGISGNPNLVFSVSARLRGSLILDSDMSVTATLFPLFEGRGSYNFKTATKTFGSFVFQPGPGLGTLTMLDSYTGTSQVILNSGTFNAVTFNMTSSSFSVTSAFTRVINMGSGTWTATGTGTIWNMTTTTGLTVNSDSSTIVIADTSVTNKTFISGGKSFNNITITGGGTGTVDFTGGPTFNIMRIGAPKTIRFTAATTTTVSKFLAQGTVGNVITISSITAATHTLSAVRGIMIGDYLNLTNSIAQGGAAWFAGRNSTNVGGNTGWKFKDYRPTQITTIGI